MTMLSFAWIVPKYRFIASSCSLLHIASSDVRLAAPFSAAAMAAISFSNRPSCLVLAAAVHPHR
eukprot:6859825-Prymnesium_polylepis.1